MPNRILKESICTSEKIASLSDFEFRLWTGLLVSADDAGRGDARPAIIKGHIFPLRDRVTVKDIDAALHGLAAKGCVSLYTVGGKPYFLFPTWAVHQRIRDSRPRFPAPEDGSFCQVAASCGELPQVAASCGELPQVAASCGLNPIQSESESNPKEGAKAPSARARFTPPTVPEVEAYCRERKNSVDAHRFVDFYASKGWKVGSQPMKDWKAAVRTWEQRENSERSTAGRKKPLSGAHNHHQREYTEDDFASIGIDLLEEPGGEEE